MKAQNGISRQANFQTLLTYLANSKLQFESPYVDGQLHGRDKFYFKTVLNDWNLYENGVLKDYCVQK